jgi:hypothetical protein
MPCESEIVDGLSFPSFGRDARPWKLSSIACKNTYVDVNLLDGVKIVF